MQRRFGRRLGWQVIENLLGRMRVAASRRKQRSAPIEPLEGRMLLSATWFVAPWGSDSAAGSLAQPLRTIQRAASVANSGDTVAIRGGIYRETVTPARNGITFEAYNGENVTVSGADVVANWAGYSANVYRAPMSWDLGEGNNQVFVDGRMINEARWPNTSSDVSHPTVETAPSISATWSSATISDPHLSGGWVGAGIHILAGEGWYAQSGVVTASGPGWLTFNYTADNSYLIPRGGNGYYLYGKFQALDSAGEWYRDPSGQLYLWAPGNPNPASHVIEAKHRQFAFDLSGRSGITLEAINIFAATIKADSGSSNTVLDHLHALYLSQFVWQPIGWDQPTDSGIELNGANSILENSTIGYSSGDGVYVGGNNVRVSNSVIHDTAYNAGDSSPVRVYGTNASVDHNFIYNAGRCGIASHGWAARVDYNVIHDVMLQTADGGGIYSIHQNGAGSEFAFNTIYNIHDSIASPHPTWFIDNGIFLDDYCFNFSIHDNQIWNTDAAVKLNYSSRGNKVYNNVLAGWMASVTGNGRGDWGGTAINNNTLYGPILQPGGGVAMYANAFSGGAPRIALPPTPAPDVLPSYGRAQAGASGSSSTGSASGTVPADAANPAPISAFGTVVAASFTSISQGTSNADGSVALPPGASISFGQLDFGAGARVLQMELLAAAGSRGLRVEFRLDTPTGQLLAALSPRGRKPHLQSARVRGKVNGVHAVYILVTGKAGQAQLGTFSFIAISRARHATNGKPSHRTGRSKARRAATTHPSIVSRRRK